MATVANLVAEAKILLNISDTSFDADLTAHAGFAIKNLAPIALNEVTPDTSKTVNADGITIDLPTGVVKVRSGGLELYDSDIADYRPCTSYIIHGTQIRLRQATTAATACRIWGLGYYKADASDLPQELEFVIVCWIVSMFYLELAGNKRKYNIYVGTTGAAADKDMKDSAAEMEQRGNTLLLDRVTLRGA